MKRFNMTGKWALITGAGGFLGKEHCAALAEIGCNVVMTDSRTEGLAEAMENLKRQFPACQFHAHRMDVTLESEIKSVFSDLTKKGIAIDVLVNNAAIDPKVQEGGLVNASRFETYSLDSWHKEISVGLTGAMLCSQVFGSDMATRGKGVIINIASDLSVIAPDQRIYRKNSIQDEAMQSVKPVTYSVIKHALLGLTKYLATYWADKGVRVNSLSPGGVYHNQPEDFVAKLTNLIPMGRMANVDEYRGCIQFLSSDASSYMTGQNLAVEGGRTVW